MSRRWTVAILMASAFLFLDFRLGGVLYLTGWSGRRANPYMFLVMEATLLMVLGGVLLLWGASRRPFRRLDLVAAAGGLVLIASPFAFGWPDSSSHLSAGLSAWAQANIDASAIRQWMDAHGGEFDGPAPPEAWPDALARLCPRRVLVDGSTLFCHRDGLSLVVTSDQTSTQPLVFRHWATEVEPGVWLY